MNKDLWKLDKNLDEYKILIKECELFSFDIFDTILFRHVTKPDDLFHLVGKIAIKKNLIRNQITPLQFKHLRRLAQNKVKKHKREINNEEYTIHEIYNTLPQNIGDLDSIKDLELCLEKEYTYLNLSIYSLIKHLKECGKKIILTSDMYLNKAEIQGILEHNNFNIDFVDDILVSCELNMSKSDGNIYDYIINRYHMFGLSIVHIGDNYTSDYRNARLRGINSVHYDIDDYLHNDGMVYESIYQNDMTPELISIRKLAGNLNNNIKEEDKFFFCLGATILGPFFTIFIEWVMNLLEQEDIENIYPLMSEGKFFEKLILNSRKYRKNNINLKLIHISRVSTYLATIDTFDETFIKKALLERKKFTVKSFIQVLGLERNTNNMILSFINKKIGMLNNVEINKLEEFLLNDNIKHTVNKNIKNRKEILYKYFIDNFEVSKFCTLDLGYKGTTARNIDKILSDGGIQFKSLHFLAIMTKNIALNLFEGISYRGFCYDKNENEELLESIFNHCQIIESIANNDVLSTIDYKLVNAKVEPVFEEKYDTENNIREKRIIQDGILFFQNLYLESLKDKKEIRREICKKSSNLLDVINRIFVFPTYREAQELGKLIFKNGFYEVDKHQFISQEGLQSFESVEELFKSEKLKEQIYWMNGMITLKEPNHLFKEFLYKDKYSNIKSNRLKSLKVVEEVMIKNIDNVCIYGAGEAGKTILEVLKVFNINPRYFIDSNSLLHGHFINKVKIIALEDALSKEMNNYIIGSFEFIDEIEKNIKEGAKSKNLEVNIIKYKA